MPKIILTEVRLAFPDIWEPKHFGGDGPASCGASLIIAPGSPALAAAKAAVKQAAVDKWGPKADEVMKTLVAKGNVICLRSGDTKPEYAGFAGNFYVSARNPQRPVVVDRNKAPLTQADGRPYAGCYVDASIDIWAQDDKKWGKRINCKLLALRFVRDGDAFGGGSVGSADDFGDLEDDVGTSEVGVADPLFG